MAQVFTEEAIVIYDPIKTIFDVPPVGGSLKQRQNITDGEYSPDRSLTPMVLSPSLQVIDPNVTDGNQTSDQTEAMTVRWYVITVENGSEIETEITSIYDPESQNHANYEKYGKGLMVNANVPAGDTVLLRMRASFVNPNSNDTLKFDRDFTLNTVPYVEFNPAIEVNIPNYMIVDPFKLTSANRNLAVTAKFLAGSLDISSNQKVTFLWEKLDGTTYRAITATDVEVVSIIRNVMTINQDCVGRCKYRVTAWHADYSAAENRRSYLMTLNRQMSGATPKPRITRGKFLKTNVKETEAELVVSVNSNEISNPENFFRSKWAVYKQSGTTKQGRVELGWNKKVVADRSITGYDKTKVPTFEMTVYSLSEYRLLYDENDNPLCDANGNYIVGQVMEN